MKPIPLLSIVLLLIFSFTGCAGSSPMPDPVITSTPGPVTSALLLITSGDVQLKRVEWNNFYPASFGTALHRGDMVKPAQNAEAFIVCENLYVWRMPAGQLSGVNNGCPQPPEAPMKDDWGVLINTRGPVDDSIPFLISPRATNLMNTNPIFHWNPVPGAKIYTVHLLSGKGLEWTGQTDKPELVYPPDAPVLKPEETYIWRVDADDGSSSTEDTTPFLSFQILDDLTKQRFKNDLEKIETSDLTAEEQGYAQIWLYRSYGLYAEAISLLDQQANSSQHPLAVYRMYGNLYEQIALPLLAKKYYEKSATLSQDTNDIETQSEIQYRLGIVYRKLGDENKALQSLLLAKNGFDQLGDVVKVKEVEQVIGNK